MYFRNSKVFRRVFFPDAIKNRNDIITDFDDLPSFEKLKKHLISLYRPEIKPTFNIHSPQLRHIFQLRVGLSHLRYHKKRHNFADTPSDKCVCRTGVEDSRHFLISCTLFSRHREALFETIETILHENNLCLMATTNPDEIILYGHPLLDKSNNHNILAATLEYITKTQRFAM